MTDASRIATSQDVVYGCLVPGGVTTFEGIDYCDNFSFGGCYVLGRAGSSLCGEVENSASASGSICLCEKAGRV